MSIRSRLKAAADAAEQYFSPPARNQAGTPQWHVELATQIGQDPSVTATVLARMEADGEAAEAIERVVAAGLTWSGAMPDRSPAGTPHQIDEQYWPEPGETCANPEHLHLPDNEPTADSDCADQEPELEAEA